MAGPLRRLAGFLRYSWAEEPILVVSVLMGFAGPPLVYLSPLTWKQQEEIRNWPTAFSMYGLSTDIEKVREEMSMKVEEQPTWTNH